METQLDQTSAKRASSSEAMRLWQSAIPIQKAQLKFAPKDLAKRYAETADVTLIGEMSKHVSSLAGKPMSGMEALITTMESAQPAYKEKWATVHALNDFFMDEFRSGRLRCFAFEKPRSISALPVEMAPEHWTALPNWETGEFKANGLHLVELRVFQTTATQPTIYKAEQLVPGRPSISKHVTSAFNFLRAEGEIDLKRSAKSHYPMVRTWIAANASGANVEAKELSDEGIRRHFSPLFKALKENSKQ